jgi:hypothetical protein
MMPWIGLKRVEYEPVATFLSNHLDPGKTPDARILEKINSPKQARLSHKGPGFPSLRMKLPELRRIQEVLDLADCPACLRAKIAMTARKWNKAHKANKDLQVKEHPQWLPKEEPAKLPIKPNNLPTVQPLPQPNAKSPVAGYPPI